MVSGYDWKGSVRAVRKIGQRWYYDFRIRRSRYRGVIPEARTKAQAETAEVRIRNKIFDRKYNTQVDTLTLAEFIENGYARQAGVGEMHLHQMRHSHARIIAEESGSITDKQDALGHRNAGTTRIYVQRIAVKKDKYSDRISRRMQQKNS